MLELKTFKVKSEATFMFNLTYAKAGYMLGGFAIGIRLGEQFSNLAGLALGTLLATLMFFAHSLMQKIFPSKRLESMTKFFFFQADVYSPRQDKKYIPVKFVDDV
jgi:hypothetical protein